MIPVDVAAETAGRHGGPGDLRLARRPAHGWTKLGNADSESRRGEAARGLTRIRRRWGCVGAEGLDMSRTWAKVKEQVRKLMRGRARSRSPCRRQAGLVSAPLQLADESLSVASALWLALVVSKPRLSAFCDGGLRSACCDGGPAECVL